MQRVGDLVEVPVVRTVVRLSDRREEAERRALIRTFVPTTECRRILAAVSRRLSEGTGGGVFIVGGYGSGKSHLLAVLADLASRDARADLEAALGPETPLPDVGSALTVPISLVAQPSARPLAEVITEALAAALGPLDAGAAAADRGLLLAAVRRAVGGTGVRGILLLLDELSEFLRAKPDRPSLREDVRFLQFLAEQGGQVGICLVATLQESLELAAETPPDVARRLRDRFVTLPLTGAHLSEVVALRLLRRPEGSAAGIAAVRRRLTAALGGLPCTDAAFDRLYPVYPPVFEHLDAMRHHLSATRGAVDFVYSHLVGDADRGIPALLDQPADHLLLPDALCDHFAMRLRETAETAPLVERAYDFYRTEGERLLGDAAPLALRLARYLVVEAAGARPRARSAAEIAMRLAVAPSAVDPDLGRDMTARALARMAEVGAYVASHPGPDGPRYALDLAADAGLLARQRVERELAQLRPDDDRIWAEAYATAGEFPLPLRALAEAREMVDTVTWQRTPRRGVVRFGPLADLAEPDLAAFLAEVATGDLDFALLVGSPHGCGEADVDRLVRLADRAAAEATGDRQAAAALAVWRPAPLDGTPDLARHLALSLALRAARQEATDAAGRAAEILAAEHAASADRVRRALAEAYLSGFVVLGDGAALGAPAVLGARSYREILERIAAQSLEARLPRHLEVMPVREWPSQEALDGVVRHFLPTGEDEPGGDPAREAVVVGFLAPLGLAERHGRTHRLRADPARSPVLALLLGLLGGGEVPLAQARRALRGPPFGLDAVSCDLVVLTALFAGLVTGRAGGRRLPLRLLAGVDDLDRVESLAAGGAAAQRLPHGLAALPFLKADPEAPYLAAQQRELWARACHWKGEHTGLARDLEALEELARHPALERWAFAPAREALSAACRLADAIQVSLSAAEGLERLAEAAGSLEQRYGPQWPQLLELAEDAHRLLGADLSRLLLAHRYLTHPALASLATAAPDLFERAGQIEQSLRAGPGLWAQAAREEALDRFSAFTRAYGERYAVAHRRAVGESAADAAEALERRYAERMRAAGLTATDPAAPWAEARRRLLGRHCALLPARTLEVEPTCVCGYRLGDPPLTADLAAYEAVLRTLPAPSAAAPGGVSASPAAPEPPRRRLAELCRALAGGAVTAGEARSRFERWLAGDASGRLADDARVQIDSEDKPSGS
jgi:hypothetical protein